MGILRDVVGAAALACSYLPVAAAAQTGSAPPIADEAFDLGRIIVVTGRRPQAEQVELDGSTVDAEAIYTFNRNSLDEAANLIPGVTASNTGGSRNERLLFVRGFDRFQVPLSIDGIRVYLPADNRLDYGRFLTPDIAEIQVAKGYASVLDGPGAMGGAVNLVTRRPSRALEMEGRAQVAFDRDLDDTGYTGFGSVGTGQERWYAQASYAANVVDYWDLPAGFRPTVNEDGGARDLSDSRDWRVNAKIGFTPNGMDEYALSYTRQEGSKNAPLETTVPLSVQRYWAWPYWNIESLYFLSTTALGDGATLRTRVYRNTFDNLLRSFNDRTQTAQTLPRAFNSYYEDEAYGGSAQLDLTLSQAATIRLAGHYRRDEHVEYQQVFPSRFVEPEQVSKEDTWSLAAEGEFRPTPTLRLTLGASFDWRDLGIAEDYGAPPGGGPARVFSYPRRNADAANGQARIEWAPDGATRLYAFVSSRARFPTIFERFSSRFGGATSSPELGAERATNYELGGARDFGRVRLEGAAFYSRLTDVIVAFPLLFGGQPVTQSRNLGTGEYHGAEVSVTASIGPEFSLGANYTFIDRELEDPGNAAFRPTGVPRHKAFAYAAWSPVPRLDIVPSLEGASDRWVTNTAGTRFLRTGSYVLASLRVDVEVLDGLVLGVGGRNLFDDAYQLADGFPEPGRSFFAGLRARY